MKIAIVHDDFMQYGGAEKLVVAMLEVFPKAQLYTAIFDPKVLKLLKIPVSSVRASFMQKIPLKKLWYRPFFFLYPLAFESLSSLGQLDRYKVVVSSTARFAHGVLTKPGTTHIAYVNSPGRMWWEPEKYFTKGWQVKLFAPFAKWLKFWDRVAMSRVDVVVANSKNVAGKVEERYGRKADLVIYPFSKCSNTNTSSISNSNSKFFLIVTRLSPWKRVDIAVKVFKANPDLGSLVVVGAGPEKRWLQRLTGGAQNITFLSGLTDSELYSYYGRARSLIVTQEEDFGITPLEALSQGTPVIAFAKGGVLETVVEGEHGVFFAKQTAESLKKALVDFSPPVGGSKGSLERQAKKFGKERFVKEITALVKKYV